MLSGMTFGGPQGAAVDMTGWGCAEDGWQGGVFGGFFLNFLLFNGDILAQWFSTKSRKCQLSAVKIKD